MSAYAGSHFSLKNISTDGAKKRRNAGGPQERPCPKVCGWSFAIVLCIVCSGTEYGALRNFHLESNVLMFLIGSNAVTIGLFAIVLKYLFSNESPLLHELLAAVKK